jgi:ADP-ribose pyrophosphatase
MNEKTLSVESIHEGRVLDLELLDVELESGIRTKREIVRHKGASAVLARREDGNFVLVRQYRKPVECDVLEIIAGMLDEGESPDKCASREVKEETGYDVKLLSKLGEVWSSPGYSSECIHVFFAELSGAAGESQLDEDEMLEVVVLDEAAIEAMIRSGEIQDAKTLASWCMWKARA